jgi:hypothetical protein
MMVHALLLSMKAKENYASNMVKHGFEFDWLFFPIRSGLHTFG